MKIGKFGFNFYIGHTDQRPRLKQYEKPIFGFYIGILDFIVSVLITYGNEKGEI